MLVQFEISDEEVNKIDALKYGKIKDVNEWAKRILLQHSVIDSFLGGTYIYRPIEGKLRSVKTDKVIMMTKLELRLLMYLKTANTVATIEEIARDVWKKPATIYTIRNIVNKIREKTQYEIIVNHSGRGYELG